METASPPKRMTRARAAAKASEAATKPMSTAKTTTAASRAKAAATTTTTKTTATKRKARADDRDDEDEMASAPVTKAARPRGRPRKVMEEPAEAEPKPARRTTTATASTVATKATRVTRAKKVAVEPAEQEDEPPKPKRGRPRKIQDEEGSEAAPKPTKTTRTRAAATAKPAIKKTVTFQEPEKENINPGTTKSKEPETKPTTGLRGRPVRRGAAVAPKATTAPTATTTRATRGRATRTTNASEKMPLSPKKAVQVTARDMESEDELAGPMKTPLMKKPVRPPPSSSLLQNKSSEAAAAETAQTEGAASKDVSEQPSAPANVLRSPAKRPPPTPFKDAMKSPPKKGEGIQPFSTSTTKSAGQQTGATPMKTSLLQSPAKRSQSAVKGMAQSSLARSDPVSSTPLKSSLLQTPARRPGSVLKAFASARQEAQQPMQSPLTKATILSTPGTAAKPSEMLMDQEEAEGTAAPRNLFAEPMPSLKFPGRLSAVLPRDADPAYDLGMTTVDEGDEDSIDMVEEVNVHEDAQVQEVGEVYVSEEAAPVNTEDEDHEMSDVSDSPQPASNEANVTEQADEPAGPAVANETNTAEQPAEPGSPLVTVKAHSPPKSAKFSLRQKDLNPFQGLDEESEDELTSSFQRNYRSPSPVHTAPTPSGLSRRASLGRRASGMGFTPLADKLGSWSAGSPTKKSEQTNQANADDTTVSSGETTVKQSFFDDEMSVREQNHVNAEIMAAIEADIDAQIGPVFEGIPITAEDVDLADEANEMSVMDPDEIEERMDGHASQEHDDALSEASQDYGDENEVPCAAPPQTPARAIPTSSHTVSKVPLKGADNSTPSPVKPRRHSVCRLPVQRPASVKRSASVISYSPTKEKSAPNTPSKESEAWSTTGTPSRTPRKDLDAGLLRGAVVFVDVRTSDGGDASEFFVELLAEMGARCVKRWDWSPASEDSAKVGITHVVYKDGGKRTLEKVREARGLVQCVGVSWVLE